MKVAFEDFDYRVLSMAFSHDGKTLALGSFPPLDKPAPKTARITLWDPSNGKQTSRIEWRDCWQVPMVAFSRDGTTLVAGKTFIKSSIQLRLWDVATGKPKNDMFGTRSYSAVAFPPDEQTLLALADAAIETLDLKTGKEKKTVTLKGLDLFLAAVFSADCQLLAATDTDKSVKVFDVNSGKLVAAYKGDGETPSSVAFNHERTTLAVGYTDGAIRIWDLPKGP